MKTTKKIHYVYKITNLNPTDERVYYIGVRSAIDPITDTYMGSSKYLNVAMKENGKENFKKEILSTWKTRKEAMQEEIRLHEDFDVAKSKTFYNKAKQTSTGFDVTDCDFHTRELMGKVNKGMVTVFDTIANKHRRVTKAEFDNNSTLLGGTPGMVSVRDTRDNTSKQVTQVEYHKYDYYVHNTKGLVTVIDTRDNKTKKVSKQDFDQNEYYVGTSTKIIKIYDNIGKLQYTSKIKFKDYCKNNSLPFNAFYESHTHNSSPLYMSFPRKENKTRVINNGNIKFKGWYAVSENF